MFPSLILENQEQKVCVTILLNLTQTTSGLKFFFLKNNSSGNYLEEKPETLINEHVDFFDSYSCVIASNMDTALVAKLAKLCEKKKQILMVVRSYGMLGYIRVQAPSHEIVEGKLDTPVDDLRIASPWPNLQKYFDAHEFEKMDYKTHCHTPYLVVLHKMVEKFKEKHGKIPTLGKDSEEEEYLELIHKEMKNASERKEIELEEKMKNGEVMDEFTQETYSSNEEENFLDAIKFGLFFCFFLILKHSKLMNLMKFLLKSKKF
jgi:hypothetical protein